MPRGAHLRFALATAVLAGAVAVSGCGSDLSPGQARACRTVVDALPSQVGDQARAERDARSVSWGDPAIELTCGVDVPDGFTKTSACQNADGLDWYVPPDQLGTKAVEVTMTTVGRSPRIQVVVPAAYWPPMAVMADLAKPVLAHTRRTTPCS